MGARKIGVLLIVVLFLKGMLVEQSFAHQKKDFSLFKTRRKELVDLIHREQGTVSGAILLIAGFEPAGQKFCQDSSFFYYTGITEPGLILLLELSGKATLFVPQFKVNRAQWLPASIQCSHDAAAWGCDALMPLGDFSVGHQLAPDAKKDVFKNIHTALAQIVGKKGKIFAFCPGSTCYSYAFGGQHVVLSCCHQVVAGFESALVDAAPFIARQRQIKDMHEVEQLYRAAEITCMAQEAAAQAIAEGVLECEVQASLEYIFTAAGTRAAFASVVGSGQQSTILHYADNKEKMRNGDVVVIDIGACYEGYCADITRTYPVSGKFSKRQKEVYDVVLATQDYIASIAKPGYWLNNEEHPEKSLNHLAKKFLTQKGYGDYIVHGIGHYLGLDVHDMGDYKQPLKEGMVFTIEPGIYIPQERLGVRIEDDYWVVKDGVVCLSEQLPKKTEDIEAFMRGEYQQQIEEDEEHDCDGDDCDCCESMDDHECGEC
jgi:Xaa-Pro aminopeptidase